MNPSWIKPAIIAALFLLTFIAGFLTERFKLVEYKSEIKGAANVEQVFVKKQDQRNDDNAKASEGNYIAAITSLDEYYRQHPVVKLQAGHCSSTLPQAPSSAQGANGATPTGYASAYSPRDTEVVAERLDGLQKHLINGGVEIK